MKTKLFLSSALVLAVLFAVTAIGVGEVSAAKGAIQAKYPPNGGSKVMMIEETDEQGTPLGRLFYVFIVPNGFEELAIGDVVTFEIGNGRTVLDVVKQEEEPTPAPIDETDDNEVVPPEDRIGCPTPCGDPDFDDIS